ncbi:hypothetical protein ACROYT_G014049 [Oculina patagonica]
MRKEQEQSLKNESYDYQHAADVQQEEWRDFLLENDQQEKAITREDLELRKCKLLFSDDESDDADEVLANTMTTVCQN